MRLRTFTAAAAFLDAVGPTLLAREAENSLLLGIALREHADGEETLATRVLAVGLDHGELS